MANNMALCKEYLNIDKRLIYIELFRKDKNISTP
jgi:hypothetical protein